MMIGKSWGEKIADVCIYAVMLLLMLAMVYPVWYVIVASFSNSTEIAKNPGIMFWPKTFELQAYRMVFVHPMFRRGFLNTIRILAVGIPLSMFLTLLCGYFMSLKGMKLKGILVGLITFTMFFGGGLIPDYLNIKSLGLTDTLWSLIVPGALSVYNAIICKTAIQALPDSLSESAYIDGASDIRIMFQIVTPLIKPTLAVLTLYYTVGKWNNWFSASIYIRKEELMPIQNVLRGILLSNSQDDGLRGDQYDKFAETIKYAAIVISSIPIMCIYPFLQKYFTKGVMIGAVKG
ncbi:MAG: carbohydrate ABC transporter permease [Eubacteriales bacterium]|nr:carbohydrate ABC transporter permease [Eubacteriales bacterium]